MAFARDVLNEINSWMSIAALCLAPLPVVGEVVDAVALVTSATQAGADLVLLSAGRKSLAEVGEDIGGLALNYAGDGVGGELAKSGVKEAEDAAKVAAKEGEDAAKAGPHHDESAAGGAKDTKAPAEAKVSKETEKPSLVRGAAHTTVHPVERIRHSAAEVSKDGYGRTMKGWLDTRNAKIVSGHTLQLSGKAGDVTINWLGGDDSAGQGGTGQGGTGRGKPGQGGTR